MAREQKKGPSLMKPERRAAKALNMSPEEYAAYKRRTAPARGRGANAIGTG